MYTIESEINNFKDISSMTPKNEVRGSESRAIGCFTCSIIRDMDPLSSETSVEDYENLIEKGYWRVGKWVYPHCSSCPQRLCRIKTDTFVKKYFKEDLTPSIRNWNSDYKKLYKNLTMEFLSADAIHKDVIKVHEHSMGQQVDEDQFMKDFCTSLIGVVPSETLKKFNTGDFKESTTGSMFVVIKSGSEPIAVLLMDICNKWVGFKTFWHKDPTAHNNKTIMLKICWFKFFELAHRLNKQYVQLSYFDPTNARLLYKLNYSPILEINAHNDGKWVPIEDLMEITTDERGNRCPKNIESYIAAINTNDTTSSTVPDIKLRPF
jgi:arginyl-tRNA--protein-N-Asp/Glu arginylyltransferase